MFRANGRPLFASRVSLLQIWLFMLADLAYETYAQGALDVWLFSTLNQVREKTWRFLLAYHEERPPDSLGDLTPLEHHSQFAENSAFEWSA